MARSLKQRFQDFKPKTIASNWNKVQSSPYASLHLAYKARIIIVAILVPYIAYLGVRMIMGFGGSGWAKIIGQLISIGVISFMCWKIYQTIPQAKKQLEYYKKFPHTINYCPTNTKVTVDEILSQFDDKTGQRITQPDKETSSKTPVKKSNFQENQQK